MRGVPNIGAAEAKQRIRAVVAEQALAEARLVITDLNQQLDRANAACVRLAQRVAAVSRRRAA